MKPTLTVVSLLLVVAVAALVLQLFLRQLASASLAFGVHPDVLSELEDSLEDQKRLAVLDPDRGAAYRARFETLETTVHRLQILDGSRDALRRRYETILFSIFGASVALVGATLVGGYAYRVRDRERRRRAVFQDLSARQESTRRHAHEMRAPLTSLGLELARIRDSIGGDDHELRRAATGAVEELDRLRGFTERLTSFARVPQPKPERRDLTALLTKFTDTYREAWPGLRLELQVLQSVEARIDAEMLRQVLVNLCDNSALAMGDRGGRLTITLSLGDGMARVDVSDDGSGVAVEIRSRIFEPYATTRSIGEGMGLGLAISRKILLDHGGDLELLRTTEAGTTFRLTIPRAR